ncbi:MAG: helix-turn-helix transcriptional regulator [Anaerolineales bacterium]|jgi:DNA-binding XRE family transcriptional regulator
MARKDMPRFEDWESEKIENVEFMAAAEELEPGYQVARLRMQRGLTQTQLAEMVGTRQPSIARLENGSSKPSLTFLNKIAAALNAKIEVKLVAGINKPA